LQRKIDFCSRNAFGAWRQNHAQATWIL